RHPDARVRADIASALGDHGAGGRDALPALKEALKDSSPEVRYNAARAITWIDPSAPEAVAPLLEVTKNRLYEYQVHQALDRLTRGTLPALEEALKSDDAQVRGEAAVTMVRTDRRTWKKALPALTEWVTDPARLREPEAPTRTREFDLPLRTALAK